MSETGTNTETASSGAEQAAAPLDGDALIQLCKLDEKRLVGELADKLLDEAKAARFNKPWDQLKEHEQANLIDRYRELARGWVRQVAVGIAARGLPWMPGDVESFTGKMGDGLIALKVAVGFTEQNAARLAHGSTKVILVFASVDAFSDKMLAKPEPDQKALELAAAGQPHAEADGEGVEGEDFDPETGEIVEREKADA